MAEKTKGQIRRELKKAALTKVLAFVKESTEDKELIEAVVALTPGQRFGTTRRTGMKDTIAALFQDKNEWDEDEIWSEYKLGRGEMHKIRVNLIKKNKPEDRVWISFDAVNGLYRLEATGAEAPEEWTGYKPITIEDMEII